MTEKARLVAEDVCALLRARNPLLWIVTREEGRAESYLFEAAAAAGYEAKCWDIAQGFTAIDGTVEREDASDVASALSYIQQRTKQTGRNAWIMRDLPVWLAGYPGARELRQLRNLIKLLPSVPRESAQAVIILSPSSEIPPELMGHVTVIDWPLPDREEIARILDGTLDGLPEDIKAGAAPNGTRDAAIGAAIGLSKEEAQATFARSLVQHRRIDVATIAGEKKRVIARDGLLEWFDPLQGGLEAVGGLENLKAWLTSRRAAYTPSARAYGLPAPKGALLVGIPGCGKSLTAKAVATAWNVPLIKIDLGALRSKFVGESERRLRLAFQIVETIGQCVLWIDEIDKALKGSTGEAGDGGVAADALGTLLSWMQDRRGEAFVIATANDVDSLPPELIRKGRFDDVWWVDLPTLTERQAILKAALRNARRPDLDVSGVAEACEGFTGAEIAELVPDALFAAFSDGEREPTASDLLVSARSVNPLSKSKADQLAKLRKWAGEQARSASTPETQATTAPTRARVIDL